jgi:hypothetical protein
MDLKKTTEVKKGNPENHTPVENEARVLLVFYFLTRGLIFL